MVENIEIEQIYGGENFGYGDFSDRSGDLQHPHGADKIQKIQKFDKDNLGEFEWFVDNVFLMSDKNSMVSEKTRNVTWVNRGVDVGGLGKHLEGIADGSGRGRGSGRELAELEARTKEIIDALHFEEDKK